MRSRAPPAPTLKNVLVSHPSTAAQGTVAAPDEFLTTAMMAADENHDLSRRRGGMFSRVSRKWQSLWQRRSSSSSTRRRDSTANNDNTNANDGNTNAATTAMSALSALRLRRPRQMLTAPDPGAAMENTQAPFHAPSSGATGASNNQGMGRKGRRGLLSKGGSNSHNSNDNMPNTTTETQPQQVIALPYHPTPTTTTKMTTTTTTTMTAAADSNAALQQQQQHQHQQQYAVNHPSSSIDNSSMLHPQYSISSAHQSNSNNPTPFTIASATSQVVLSRERRLRAEREEQMALERAADDDLLDELTVSSMLSREPSRRVRQVGAREDDDILLELPRVDPVSLSLTEMSGAGRMVPPLYNVQQQMGMMMGGPGPGASNDLVSRNTPKVRQLPRVSGLMPTRAARAPSSDVILTPPERSPSSGRTSSRRNSRGVARTMSYDERRSDDDDEEDDRYRDDDDDQDGDDEQLSDSGSNYSRESEGENSDQYENREVRAQIHFDEDNVDDDHFVDEENVDGEIDDEYEDGEDENEDQVEETTATRSPESEEQQQPPTRIPRAPRMRRMPIARLPTGMSRRDVEREMERAVVEIASDGDESGSGEIETEEQENSQLQTQGKDLGVASTDRGDDDDATQAKEEDVCHSSQIAEHEQFSDMRVLERKLGSLSFGLVGFGSSGGGERNKSRSKTKMRKSSRPGNTFWPSVLGGGGSSASNSGSGSQLPPTISATSSRTIATAAYLAAGTNMGSSPSQSSACSSPRSTGGGVGRIGLNIGRRKYQQNNNDVALFEDDYLSFQGFHSGNVNSSTVTETIEGGNAGSHDHHSGMSSLLKAKRISSITDSHSDESVDTMARRINKQGAIGTGLETRARSESLSRRTHRYGHSHEGGRGAPNGGGSMGRRSKIVTGHGHVSAMRGQGRQVNQGQGGGMRSSRGKGSGLNRSGRLPMVLNLRKWSSLEAEGAKHKQSV